MTEAAARGSSRALEPHVALLRGINVGGKNPLPMTALRELFEGCGAGAVRTYIQSGNVLFRASTAQARRTAAAATNAIRERFGYEISVLVRSRTQLEAVLNANPFSGRPGVDPSGLHVLFLAGTPSLTQIKALDPGRSRPDRFAVVGDSVFLHCPNGLGRSKLTNDWFDRGLETRSTCRNWQTVSKLHELLGNFSGPTSSRAT